MKHFNSHQPCVTLIKTNGRDPNFHEIVEIVAIPLDNLEYSKSYTPYDVKIRPSEQGNLSRTEYVDHLKYGLDTHTAFDVFDRWYQKLNLRFNKRIMPVSFNWPLQQVFLEKWMGYHKHVAVFDDYFSPLFRDLLPISLYWADLAELNDCVVPFPSQTLSQMGTRLQCPAPKSKTLLDRAFFLLDIYSKITSFYLPTGVDLPLNYPSPAVYERDLEDSVSETEDEGSFGGLHP